MSKSCTYPDQGCPNMDLVEFSCLLGESYECPFQDEGIPTRKELDVSSVVDITDWLKSDPDYFHFRGKR